MKKKLKNMRFGFTIAELLITMFIAMIVAAAMVPLVGPKKIKFPEFNKVHGIYECYWDGETLRAYYADSEHVNGDSSKEEVVGEYCKFTPPDGADHFEIYAITSGTDGYLGNPEDDISASVGPSNTPINEGKLSLTNFGPLDSISSDLAKITSTVTDDLYKIPDPKNEGKFLPLKNVVAGIFNDRWEIGDNSGTYSASERPYAVITDFHSAVAPGGGGFAKSFSVEKTKKNNTDEYCIPDTSKFYGPAPSAESSNYTTGGKFDIDKYKKYLHENGYCYGYVHHPGTDSVPGFRLREGYKILFPITGYSGELSADTQMTGSTTTSTFPAIAFSFADKNGNISDIFKVQYFAQAEPAGGYGDALFNGNAGNYNFENIGRSGKTRKVRLLGNSSTLCSKCKIMYMDNNGNIDKLKEQDFGDPAVTFTEKPYAPFEFYTNEGTKKGQEINDGKICYEKDGLCVDDKESTRIYAGAKFMDDGAFTWAQNGLDANIRYVNAGKPGNIEVFRTNSLDGAPLYLFPDKNNTSSTVVSKSSDISDLKSYIVSAQVIDATNTGGQNVTNAPAYILHDNMLPYPEKSIINATVPDNSRFSYLEAIKATRFRENAIRALCGDEKNRCPGYGGAGAYPLISHFSTHFNVVVTNQQEGFKNKTYEKDIDVEYNLRKDGEPQKLKCANKNIDSITIGENDVCRGSEHFRGRGAVIILW